MRVGKRTCILALMTFVCVIGLAATSPTATPTLPAITASDHATMARLALHWAVNGGITDFNLVKDAATLVVADSNLPKNVDLKLDGHAVSVLPLQSIQAMANEHGDFLYFRFAPLVQRDQRVNVAIALVWAVSVKSTAVYMSGGGATLAFERQNGTWMLLPVTEHWMSLKRKQPDKGDLPCSPVLPS